MTGNRETAIRNLPKDKRTKKITSPGRTPGTKQLAELYEALDAQALVTGKTFAEVFVKEAMTEKRVPLMIALANKIWPNLQAIAMQHSASEQLAELLEGIKGSASMLPQNE